MTLDELRRAAARARSSRRRRRSPITAVTHDSRARGPGRAVRGHPRPRHRRQPVRRRRAQEGRGRGRLRGAAAAGRRPGSRCRTRARRWPLLLGRRARRSRPARSTLVGVTGTNGKTTTSYLIDAALRAAGHKVGLLGTVQYRIGDRLAEAVRTTPEASDLQALFREMVDAGCTPRRARGLVALPRPRSACTAARSRSRSSPTSPATTSTSTATWTRYFAAKRRLFDTLLRAGRPRGPERRRRPRAPTLAAASRGAGVDLRHRRTRPTSAPRTSRSRLDGTRFRAAHAAGRLRGARRRSSAASTCRTCWPRSAPRWRSASTRRPRCAGLASVTGVPGRLERVHGRPGLHGDRRLRAHRRRAQEPAGDRARAEAAAASSPSSAAAATATAPSARSWARWPRASPTS